MALREQFRRDLTHLRLKGIRYWLVALSLVPLGMLAGDTLGKWDVWVTLRYKIYHALQDLSPHFSKRSKRTVIVLIEDEEYWKGELARRVPLKRCYLARLVSRLDLADPAAIGLDVDLRSQTPDNSLVVHHDYQEETAKLAEAIRYTSANRCVVLPRTLERLHGKSVPEPAIFDNKGLMGDSLKVGYASLPYDLRRVPLVLKLADNAVLDSFAAALARCVDESSVMEAQEENEDALPFGTFIGYKGFKIVPSQQVLEMPPDQLRKLIAHQVVIIGGAWHENMMGRGRIIDYHQTPSGNLPGALVHGNYVEAILYHRTYAPVSKWAGVFIEILVSILVALVFALDRSVTQKGVVVSSLGIFLVLFSLFSWQNLGLFFDFFIPSILLAGHVAAEQVIEWKNEADKSKSKT